MSLFLAKKTKLFVVVRVLLPSPAGKFLGTDHKRTVIRVSRLRFTAINDSGTPFLTELLPLATRFATIKNALLALAQVLRAPSPTRAGPSPSAATLETYQVALTTLREKMASLDVSKASDLDVMEVLGAALLLTIAGFPGSGQGSTAWSHHIAGLITLIESINLDIIDATVLGTYVKESVAYLDIAAFSVGRPLKARHVWLKWDIQPPEAPSADDFSSLEVVVGYPKSLLTIISTASAIFDGTDEFSLEELSALVKRLYVHCSGEPSEKVAEADKTKASGLVNDLETILNYWEPPKIPLRLSNPASMALAGAWEIMRKAALLYVWRGGFTANMLFPLPPERAVLVPKFIREMLFGFRALLSYLDDDGITIMNVMTWSLTVAGNECGGDRRSQHEVAHLVSVIQTNFHMHHLGDVSRILSELWRRYETQSQTFAESEGNCHLCLDKLSKDLGICTTLF